MEALLSGRGWLRERFLVLHGDNYFSQGLGYFVEQSKGTGYAFLTDAQIEEEAKRLATTGAYILPPEVFEIAEPLRYRDELVCLVEALFLARAAISEVSLQGWRANINTWDDLIEVNRRLLRGWRSSFHPPGAEGGYWEERLLWVSPQARAHNSRLGPYVGVGPGAWVERCHLEEVIVFPHSQVDGLVLKRGVVLPHHIIEL